MYLALQIIRWQGREKQGRSTSTERDGTTQETLGVLNTSEAKDNITTHTGNNTLRKRGHSLRGVCLEYFSSFFIPYLIHPFLPLSSVCIHPILASFLPPTIHPSIQLSFLLSVHQWTHDYLTLSILHPFNLLTFPLFQILSFFFPVLLRQLKIPPSYDLPLIQMFSLLHLHSLLKCRLQSLGFSPLLPFLLPASCLYL